MQEAIGCRVFSYSMYPFAFEMGGRNQKTQLVRSWCAGPGVEKGPPLDSERDVVLDEVVPMTLLKPPSLEDFSAPGVLAEAPPREISKGFPGDLGVLPEPKDANAPEPRPKALDAPVVGDARAPGVVMGLKGLDLPPCEELSPPNRLEKVLRPEGLSPWALLPEVDRESLVELRVGSGLVSRRGRGGRRRSHLLRRLHRLSMEKSGV